MKMRYGDIYHGLTVPLPTSMVV